MKKRGKQNTLSLAAALLTAALTLGLKASAEPSWVPGTFAHQAQERGEQCSILRSLASDHGRNVGLYRGTLEKQIDSLKAKRAGLEACAREKGIAVNGSDRSEGMMAEFCGPQFALWLHQGSQLEMVRQDLVQTTRDLEWLSGRLRVECPSPTTVANRVPVKGFEKSLWVGKTKTAIRGDMPSPAQRSGGIPLLPGVGDEASESKSREEASRPTAISGEDVEEGTDPGVGDEASAKSPKSDLSVFESVEVPHGGGPMPLPKRTRTAWLRGKSLPE